MPYSADLVSERRILTDWLGDNVVYRVNFLLGELTSALVVINLGDLEGEEGKSSANTLDHSERVGNLLLTVHVGVLHTNDVLKIIGILNYYG